MRVTLSAFLIAAALVGACAPQGNDRTNRETPLVPARGNYSPRPEDAGLRRGAAFVDSVDLLTMESYPLQFSLSLKGNLPTPCNQLRVSVAPPDKDNKIAVEVYSVVDPNRMCAEVLQPFEVSVPLGSFPAGHYNLLVNGRMAAEMDA